MLTQAERLADNALLDRVRDGPPINLARAYEVMEAESLDGIVLGDPLNVFHATGFWPQIARTRVGQPPLTLALITRDSRQAIGLVTSRFNYYYTFADTGIRYPFQTFIYEQPGDDREGAQDAFTTAHSAAYSFHDHKVQPLDPVELLRGDLTAEAVRERGAVHDGGAALTRAMKDMGLWGGRIGFDNPLICAICENHDFPGALVGADNTMRAIRLVKSPLEIDLMRRASYANVAAAIATGKALRAGASYGEMFQVFGQEAAARGNQPVFMNLDRVSSPLNDYTVRDGTTVFIDAVSHFHSYHGDYGRTFFVGEPTREMTRASEALTIGWSAIREMLRPGVRYSQIVDVGRAAVKQAGHDYAISFTPHSVGLMHTDEPCRVSGGYYIKDDIELRENMILSVDCPLLATGLGGSAHLEDLTLITEDGSEPIHAVGPPVIAV